MSVNEQNDPRKAIETPKLALDFTICGVGELDAHCVRGVTHIVSILDPEWPIPDSFSKYGDHKRLDLRFHDIIEHVQGALAPGNDEVGQILAFGSDMLSLKENLPHLLIHCQMGVSRSTAAAALILAQAHPELSASEILSFIVKHRPQAWPNLRMIEMGDQRLKRSGELITAVRAHYRKRVSERPELIDIMSGMGRGAELVGLR